MKHLLFALCFVALLSAITVELQEGAFGTIEYTVEDRNAYNSTLTIVVMRESIQHSVYSVEGFNGLYAGEFQILEPATYTVKVYNMDTGESGESTIALSPEIISAEIAPVVEEAKKQQAEEYTTVKLSEEQASFLPYLIVGLFILLIIVLLFANPLKKPKKKK